MMDESTGTTCLRDQWHGLVYLLAEPEEGLSAVALACFTDEEGNTYCDREGIYGYPSLADRCARDYAHQLNLRGASLLDVETAVDTSELPIGTFASGQDIEDDLRVHQMRMSGRGFRDLRFG